ncbi:hypothetical protein C3Y89_24155 [Rhizobium sp. UPM1132]|uniref:tyrosine-type recombinase/integrase n=1 Tax=Rhizobium ruizarguesonis TaxID=2081791 RepID=UPI001448508F|nr:hypothetical protein [Rhizobium ruizarguesonis]NKQ73401.1 hypothetical protein [Rhizobium ruizarguesonis]
MPSEVFSKFTFNKVTNLVRKGVDKKIKFSDKECAGLAIIVSPTVATWYISTRDMNVAIAPFNQFSHDDLPSLRKFVEMARREKKADKKIDAMIEAFGKSGSVDDAKTIHDVEHNGALRWEAARDLYLDWLKENRNANTYRTYKSALGVGALSADFAPITGKPLASIENADLVDIRENITTRGRLGSAKGSGIRQSDFTVTVIKAAFTYFMNMPKVFGLKTNPSSDLRKSPNRDPNQKKLTHDRALTQLEIGAFLYGLEDCRNEMVRTCLTLQLLSGQRRFTPTTARLTDFAVSSFYGYTWTFEDKAHAWRCLPLTAEMKELVTKAMRVAKGYESPFLFPQQRAKRKGDDLDSHVNERTISRGMEHMRKAGGVFHDLDFAVATHDLRRTFVTHMGPKMADFYIGNRQLEPDDVEMITHKNEGRERVSMLRYDKNSYLDVKVQILQAWADFCWEGYRMYVQRLDKKPLAA